MKNALLIALAGAFLSSCSLLRDTEQKRDDALEFLAKTTSGTPTTDSTSARAAQEIRLLDSLQRKHPGRTTRTIVTKIEKVVVPGKVVYVEIAPKVDSARNKSEADSILARLVVLSKKYQRDLEFQTEVAEVKAGLISSLNKRGILPDTTVFFPNAPGYWLRVHRLASGRYSWTLNTPERTQDVPTQTTVIKHTPPVYIRSDFWDFWQFWAVAAVGLASLLAAGWLLRTLIVDRRPAASERVSA